MRLIRTTVNLCWSIVTPSAFQKDLQRLRRDSAVLLPRLKQSCKSDAASNRQDLFEREPPLLLPLPLLFFLLLPPLLPLRPFPFPLPRFSLPERPRVFRMPCGAGVAAREGFFFFPFPWLLRPREELLASLLPLEPVLEPAREQPEDLPLDC